MLIYNKKQNKEPIKKYDIIINNSLPYPDIVALILIVNLLYKESMIINTEYVYLAKSVFIYFIIFKQQKYEKIFIFNAASSIKNRKIIINN